MVRVNSNKKIRATYGEKRRLIVEIQNCLILDQFYVKSVDTRLTKLRIWIDSCRNRLSPWDLSRENAPKRPLRLGAFSRDRSHGLNLFLHESIHLLIHLENEYHVQLRTASSWFCFRSTFRSLLLEARGPHCWQAIHAYYRDTYYVVSCWFSSYFCRKVGASKSIKLYFRHGRIRAMPQEFSPF